MALLPREQSKGQRLTARNWNDSVDAITRHQNAIERRTPTPSTLKGQANIGTVCEIHNNTGVYLSPRDIAGIDTHTFPTDPEQTTITVVSPEEGTHDGKFVITLDGIPNGTIGKAIISGVALCTVTMNDAAHEFARIVDADTTKLESTPAGMARILWHEELVGSGAEDALALVEFPLSGPPLVWEATADESAGEITAKQLDSTGTLTGTELTFTVLPD